MEVTITAAVSVDGFICTLDNDSDWVEDDEVFEKLVGDYSCIVLGRTTFEQYPDDYPIPEVQHFVLTSGESKSKGNVHFVNSVEQAIQKAEELGFSKLLVIGGAKTNESFITSGKVQKLFLDIHPLALGKGKKLFGDFSGHLKLKFLTCEHHNNFMHVQYEVKE